MAILDRPLYGDSATGKIKHTLSFAQRSANTESTDPLPGAQSIARFVSYRKPGSSPSRATQKEKFHQAVLEWQALTQEQKQAYQGQTINLETAFNAYMKERIPQL